MWIVVFSQSMMLCLSRKKVKEGGKLPTINLFIDCEITRKIPKLSANNLIKINSKKDYDAFANRNLYALPCPPLSPPNKMFLIMKSNQINALKCFVIIIFPLK